MRTLGIASFVLILLVGPGALPARADDLGGPPAGESLPPGQPAPPAGTPAAGPVPASPPVAPPVAPAGPAVPVPPPPPPPSHPSEGAATPAVAPPTEAVAPVELSDRYPADCKPRLAPPCPEPDPCLPDGRWVSPRNYDRLMVSDPTKPIRNAWWGGSLSFLPQIGIAVEIGGVWKRTLSTVWAWEASATWQFVDDELFADDGNPASDDWWQVQIGAKVFSNPNQRRHWTGRFGAVWCYAEGIPNIVEKEGNYLGAYAGFGYEADISGSFSTGPEISGLFVFHEDGGFSVIPQFNWHFIWSF